MVIAQQLIKTEMEQSINTSQTKVMSFSSQPVNGKTLVGYQPVMAKNDSSSDVKLITIENQNSTLTRKFISPDYRRRIFSSQEQKKNHQRNSSVSPNDKDKAHGSFPRNQQSFISN